MRKFCLLSTLVLGLFATTYSQDFSNKGKEFWLAYSYHVGMVNPGNTPVMTLYITSDQATSYTVEIFGVTTIASGNINAGQVATVTIPNTYFINNEGVFTKKAIRVTSAKPSVVYSYITMSAASGATLCLPTQVLGREYVSMNYTQISNEANSNSYVTVVAVEDNTTVEIVPAANTKGGKPGGVAYTVMLNKGDIYQVLGTAGQTTGVDMTGTQIRSVASAAGGCKKIAVFSGSGKIAIGCGGSGTSDNLYQQLYPKASWGKKYLTIPSYNRPNAIYRIVKSSAAANVYLNGTLIPAASFVNNTFYEFTNTIPNKIESDEPICVAQYFTTQNCAGNGAPFDPDMIVLNPVEQNIDKVTLVSSNLAATGNRQHHLHVIMKNSGTALSSFKLDGVPVPVSSWIVDPADPAYSYIYLSNVAQGYHTLASDTGFNALAYGYADLETYGYSAGSSIKDLYQYVTVDNDYATVDFPAACKGTPFFLSMTLPYEPTSIEWQFNGLFPDVTMNSPAFVSTKVVNGRTLYKYKIANPFSTATAGTYPIKVVVQNPTADGCSGEQEIDYDLQVFEPPVADFNFATNGCVSNPVSFTDKSNGNGRTITHWHWNFADGNTKDDISSATHTYAAAGSYDVKYTLITDVGCKADTVKHTVILDEPPVAAFSIATPYCAGKAVTFKDGSSAMGSSAIAKWYWNFGDGSPLVTATSNADQLHIYAGTGTYTVTLQVETASGCLSTVVNSSIVVHANPVVDFNLPVVCLPSGNASFNSLSTIPDGTENFFTYSWNFGDASAAGTGASPAHIYTATGPYTVSLAVTSSNGCVTTASKTLSTIYAEPVVAWTAPAEICLGNTINFTDQSSAPNSSIVQWNWDFGDATGSMVQNPGKFFATDGSYTVKLSVTSAVGCQSVTSFAPKTIVVNKLPSANFTTSLPGCEQQDITFTDASVANAGNIVKWNWDYGDGNNKVKNNATSFVYNYASAKTYPASLQVETDKGCKSPVTLQNIVINPVPDARFAAPDICVSDLAPPFIDASVIASGSVTGWQWTFGDANANMANPDISLSQQAVHHYSLPGMYTTQLIVTSNAGCKDTVQHTFSVNGAVLTPQFTVTNTTAAVCSNNNVMIKDGSRVDAGHIVRVEIFWDANDLSVKTIDNTPVLGKVYAHAYAEFASPASKTYRIRYDVYSGIVCVNSYTQDVTVLATPALGFSAISPVCSNENSFRLTQAQLLNGLPGSGVYTGNGVSSSGVFNPALAGSGTHTITYTYTGTNGCINKAGQPVVVYPTPVANAGPDRVVLEGGVVALTPELVTNIPVTYNWTPAQWLNNAAIAKPSASPLADITYQLTVTSDKGCKTSDAVFVKLLLAPVIPNIFSPNGDGIHDRWVIDYLESYPGCVIQIYNRYGQQVYRTVNYATPWDGKISGQDAPVGTYYYIIDPKNGRAPLTGYVDIIR